MGRHDNNDNDKNKNPWGSNKGRGDNPWGSGGGHGGHGGGGNPPDFDELLRRLQDNMRQIFPGGFGGGKIITLVLVGVVTLWLASGFYIISPGEHGVIQRFGAWEETKTTEGLGYHWPYPVESLTIVKVNEIRRMNIGFVETYSSRTGSSNIADVSEESQMLTSDRNIVDLDMVIQWNIKSAEDFLFEVEDQENTIKKVAESAIREVAGQTNMFPIITTERAAVADRTKQIIQENLDEYDSGVNITQVLIQQAEVHPDVQAAFQDVQSAKQDADDVQNRAEAYREDILPKARGAAIQLIQEAQGYEQSVTARANGDAERFNSVFEAYKTGEDVTRKRIYLETMEVVLRNAQKIILDEKGNGSGVVPYLPLNELRPAAGSARNNVIDNGGGSSSGGSSSSAYISDPYR